MNLSVPSETVGWHPISNVTVSGDRNWLDYKDKTLNRISRISALIRNKKKKVVGFFLPALPRVGTEKAPSERNKPSPDPKSWVAS